MGKPYDEAAPSPATLGESASAISLDTTPGDLPVTRYFDDDPAELGDDDLPPLYSDHAYTDDDAALPPRVRVNPLIPGRVAGTEIEPFFRDTKNDTAYYIDKRLETDPKFLQDQIKRLSLIPPRPYARIRGVHTESVKKGDKTERQEMVDFDVQVELTHLLYEDIRTHKAWRELKTVGNFEKVRRGTIFATRAPGFGGSGAAEEGTPGVDEWCHRFTASHAGLKNMVLERRIVGWNWDLLRKKLEGLVNATNYRGHATVTFPVHNARVEILNDCRTNRWRLTKWIEMLFVFTLMFLFSWPWLFFRTKRWETLYVEWQLSKYSEDGAKKYATLSEERWYNLWGRAIQKAMLDRRQGVLDQGDLDRAEGSTPNSEGLAGVMQAGIEAMGVVNRSFGWGGDR